MSRPEDITFKVSSFYGQAAKLLPLCITLIQTLDTQLTLKNKPNIVFELFEL